MLHPLTRSVRVGTLALVGLLLAALVTPGSGNRAEPAPPGTEASSTLPAPTTTNPPNARAIMEAGVATTTTSTTVAPAGGRAAYRHPDWIALAVSVGWPNDPAVLAVLDIVIQRESNGRPDAWNRSDPMTGSYGLTQVNGFWCSPTQYNPDGFMQAQGIGVSVCADLFDPAVNLRAALVIWSRHGNFGAWSTV